MESGKRFLMVFLVIPIVQCLLIDMEIETTEVIWKEVVSQISFDDVKWKDLKID